MNLKDFFNLLYSEKFIYMLKGMFLELAIIFFMLFLIDHNITSVIAGSCNLIAFLVIDK